MCSSSIIDKGLFSVRDGNIEKEVGSCLDILLYKVVFKSLKELRNKAVEFWRNMMQLYWIGLELEFYFLTPSNS